MVCKKNSLDWGLLELMILPLTGRVAYRQRTLTEFRELQVRFPVWPFLSLSTGLPRNRQGRTGGRVWDGRRNGLGLGEADLIQRMEAYLRKTGGWARFSC